MLMNGYVRDVKVNGPKPSLKDKKPHATTWCPHCGDDHIKKYGSNSAGTPRYMCGNPKCHRTFSLGSKRQWIYTDNFKSNVVLYYQIGSYGSLRATAKACGVSVNTLYRWLGKHGNNMFPRPYQGKNKQYCYSDASTGPM